MHKPKNDKYTIEGQYLDHEHTNLVTGERLLHRYWVPAGGGYVRVDTSRSLNKIGTLGSQPTDSNGNTWRAKDPQAVKQLVQAERRRERRERREFNRDVY